MTKSGITGEFGNRLKKMLVHSIADPATLSPLGAVSKFNIEPDFLEFLFTAGRQAATRWLASTFDKIGVENSVDIRAHFPCEIAAKRQSGTEAIMTQRRSRFSLLALSILLVAGTAIGTALACTRTLYVGADNTVITGRSMDWMEDMFFQPVGLPARHEARRCGRADRNKVDLQIRQPHRIRL